MGLCFREPPRCFCAACSHLPCLPSITVRLAEQLDKLRKNQERRLQRKNAKMGVTGDVFLPGGKKVKNETTVRLCPLASICVDAADCDVAPVPQRRCGNCGQIGHMKTNRKCPKWAVSCLRHLAEILTDPSVIHRSSTRQTISNREPTLRRTLATPLRSDCQASLRGTSKAGSNAIAVQRKYTVVVQIYGSRQADFTIFTRDLGASVCRTCSADTRRPARRRGDPLWVGLHAL